MKERLRALDELISAAAPTFHKKMEPGATDAQLDDLRAAVGVLPNDVETWFRWHAGSGDGLVPGTAWGQVMIEEAIREVHFARSPSGSPELAASTFVPLLSARDGGLMYYVASANGDGSVWEYDRGERTKTTPFREWLDALIETWRSQGSVLRVEWFRSQRSMTGAQEIHLPKRARGRLRKLLEQLPMKIEDCVRLDGTSAARIEAGPTPSWTARADLSGGQIDIVLTPEGARELAASLADKKKETIRIPGLEDLRVALLDR
ncbi:MAG TPA: hypothetical protein VLT33_33700 [Labilithrix sp.]|nr:hypothetical protein [Labilithrix sp.]